MLQYFEVISSNKKKKKWEKNEILVAEFRTI